MSAFEQLPASKGWEGTKHTHRLVLLTCLVLALSVRFYSIDLNPIWYDEAFGIRVAHQAPAQILALAGKDNHPPLYYLILHYWIHWFGDSAGAVRSLGVLADIGAMVLALKLLSLVATSAATRIAALLLALLPSSVQISQDVRMYPLLALWLMAATVALVCWSQMPQHKRYPLLYVLLMSMAMYTHYFAALCVLTHWVFWSQAWARKATGISLQGWLTANGAVVALFLPWVPVLLEQVAMKPDFGWIPVMSLESAMELISQLSFGATSVDNLTEWQLWPAMVVVACAVVVVLRDRSNARYGGLLVAYFFVPLTALMLLSVFKSTLVFRYFYFAALGMPLIVAVALEAGWQRNRKLVIVVLFALVIHEIQVLVAMTRIDPLAPHTDVLAAGLQAQSRPGDEIVVGDMLWYLPLDYYLKAGSVPRMYTGRFAGKSWGYPNYGVWALMPQPLQLYVRDDEALLHLTAKRVWWITERLNVEDISRISPRWKRQGTIDGGAIEARLYIQE